ncbi:hypothetical protein LTS18_008189, partial [Coniosporium uncinatum]
MSRWASLLSAGIATFCGIQIGVYALQPAFAQYDRERRGEPLLEQPANASLPQAPQPLFPTTPVKREAPKT